MTCRDGRAASKRASSEPESRLTELGKGARFPSNLTPPCRTPEPDSSPGLAPSARLHLGRGLYSDRDSMAAHESTGVAKIDTGPAFPVAAFTVSDLGQMLTGAQWSLPVAWPEIASLDACRGPGATDHAPCRLQDHGAIIRCVPRRTTGAAEARSKTGTKGQDPRIQGSSLIIGYRHAGTPKWPSGMDSLAPSVWAPLRTAPSFELTQHITIDGEEDILDLYDHAGPDRGVAVTDLARRGASMAGGVTHRSSRAIPSPLLEPVRAYEVDQLLAPRQPPVWGMAMPLPGKWNRALDLATNSAPPPPLRYCKLQPKTDGGGKGRRGKPGSDACTMNHFHTLSHDTQSLTDCRIQFYLATVPYDISPLIPLPGASSRLRTGPSAMQRLQTCHHYAMEAKPVMRNNGSRAVSFLFWDHLEPPEPLAHAMQREALGGGRAAEVGQKPILRISPSERSLLTWTKNLNPASLISSFSSATELGVELNICRHLQSKISTPIARSVVPLRSSLSRAHSTRAVSSSRSNSLFPASTASRHSCSCVTLCTSTTDSSPHLPASFVSGVSAEHGPVFTWSSGACMGYERDTHASAELMFLEKRCAASGRKDHEYHSLSVCANRTLAGSMTRPSAIEVVRYPGRGPLLMCSASSCRQRRLSCPLSSTLRFFELELRVVLTMTVVCPRLRWHHGPLWGCNYFLPSRWPVGSKLLIVTGHFRPKVLWAAALLSGLRGRFRADNWFSEMGSLAGKILLQPDNIFFGVIPTSRALAYARIKLTLSTGAESVRQVNF
ncbi:hypothetical protein HRG_012327 [Hirsutella rhossiliensis]